MGQSQSSVDGGNIKKHPYQRASTFDVETTGKERAICPYKQNEGNASSKWASCHGVSSSTTFCSSMPQQITTKGRGGRSFATRRQDAFEELDDSGVQSPGEDSLACSPSCPVSPIGSMSLGCSPLEENLQTREEHKLLKLAFEEIKRNEDVLAWRGFERMFKNMPQMAERYITSPSRPIRHVQSWELMGQGIVILNWLEKTMLASRKPRLFRKLIAQLVKSHAVHGVTICEMITAFNTFHLVTAAHMFDQINSLNEHADVYRTLNKFFSSTLHELYQLANKEAEKDHLQQLKLGLTRSCSIDDFRDAVLLKQNAIKTNRKVGYFGCQQSVDIC